MPFKFWRNTVFCEVSYIRQPEWFQKKKKKKEKCSHTEIATCETCRRKTKQYFRLLGGKYKLPKKQKEDCKKISKSRAFMQ